MNPPIPFGTHTKHYGKIHHFEWLNQLFLWPFSSSLFVCLPEGTTGSGETNLVPGFFPIAMFDQRTHLSTYPIHISSVSLKDMKNHMKSHTKSWFIPLIWHIKPSKLRCVPRGNICCWSAVPSWARWLRRSQSMEHVVKSWENGGRNKEWSGIIGIWMGISPTIWINIIHGIILNFVMFYLPATYGLEPVTT